MRKASLHPNHGCRLFGLRPNDNSGWGPESSTRTSSKGLIRLGPLMGNKGFGLARRRGPEKLLTEQKPALEIHPGHETSNPEKNNSLALLNESLLVCRACHGAVSPACVHALSGAAPNGGFPACFATLGRPPRQAEEPGDAQ